MMAPSSIPRFFWVWILAYALFLAWISLSPGSNEPPVFPHVDKILHFGAYGLFALLCLPKLKSTLSTLIVALAVFTFGGLMEIGQGYVPLRQSSMADMVANTLGMLTGIGVAQYLRLMLARRGNKGEAIIRHKKTRW